MMDDALLTVLSEISSTSRIYQVEEESSETIEMFLGESRNCPDVKNKDESVLFVPVTSDEQTTENNIKQNPLKFNVVEDVTVDGNDDNTAIELDAKFSFDELYDTLTADLSKITPTMNKASSFSNLSIPNDTDEIQNSLPSLPRLQSEILNYKSDLSMLAGYNGVQGSDLSFIDTKLQKTISTVREPLKSILGVKNCDGARQVSWNEVQLSADLDVLKELRIQRRNRKQKRKKRQLNADGNVQASKPDGKVEITASGDIGESNKRDLPPEAQSQSNEQDIIDDRDGNMNLGQTSIGSSLITLDEIRNGQKVKHDVLKVDTSVSMAKNTLELSSIHASKDTGKKNRLCNERIEKKDQPTEIKNKKIPPTRKYMKRIEKDKEKDRRNFMFIRSKSSQLLAEAVKKREKRHFNVNEFLDKSKRISTSASSGSENNVSQCNIWHQSEVIKDAVLDQKKQFNVNAKEHMKNEEMNKMAHEHTFAGSMIVS
eukprot:CAMPEP_0113302934 /NCGR_PEP_ID=MMETSP0010_2-20120614/3558_1 /TAXON_ID=216773 ORGANISM="Corethron hystrix, Strain 308" /NCGR_SAMPLE_ID=MMETSP0010_2 /ASSEMBLY_ACC=CAM_ASM_000155 /LENGTH=484 /DNA_ID=CAMNT_0000156843 /DNA_START=72 /DNA_END=1526 /DNA_ORIENTATION=- /assembly_acc=CAM_ASM_000155